MKNTTNYLTDENLFRGLITRSLPIIASNLLQSVLEVVDLYFVGRLGADAIAGVAMRLVLPNLSADTPRWFRCKFLLITNHWKWSKQRCAR